MSEWNIWKSMGENPDVDKPLMELIVKVLEAKTDVEMRSMGAAPLPYDFYGIPIMHSARAAVTSKHMLKLDDFLNGNVKEAAKIFESTLVPRACFVLMDMSVLKLALE